MARCNVHPDVPTQQRCALCGEPFCAACLLSVSSVGPLCASCERQVLEVPPDAREAALPELRRRARADASRQPRWWGWDLLYWQAVVLPWLVAWYALSGMFEARTLLTQISLEPRLPALTLARLTEVAARLEAHRMRHSEYPAQLEELRDTANDSPPTLTDPYGTGPQPLLYRRIDGDYRLCSRGPDRQPSQGLPLHRFSVRGDLCVGGTVPRSQTGVPLED